MSEVFEKQDRKEKVRALKISEMVKGRLVNEVFDFEDDLKSV